MAQWYHCFTCKKLTPISKRDKQSPDEMTCSICGTNNGEVISGERAMEGLAAGVFFNIDPKTGKGAKKRR
jgi:hypothetical protein